MSVRSVLELVVHLESFRNIDLWFQGTYTLKVQIESLAEGKIVYAHPFAHTESHRFSQDDLMGYTTNLIRAASIDVGTSSFMSKSFELRYLEEQVQLNDICHLRIESDLVEEEIELILSISLLHHQKFIDEDTTIDNTIIPARTNRYILKNVRRGLHEFIPIIFEAQFFSLVNLTVHSVCLDQRFRISQMQLSEYSQLTHSEKQRLLQRRRGKDGRISYFDNCAKQLRLSPKADSLAAMENLLLKNAKRNYESLLKEYQCLYQKVVGKEERIDHKVPAPEELLLPEHQPRVLNYSRQKTEGLKPLNSSCEEIFRQLLDECNAIYEPMQKLWTHFVNIIKISPRLSCAHYCQCYNRNETDYWANFVNENRVERDLCLSQNTLLQTQHRDLAQNKRNILEKKNLNRVDWIDKKQITPTVVENIYHCQIEKEKESEVDKEVANENPQLHLVVLVHGFQGNSADMRLIKNNISVLRPETIFLCSAANEQFTDGDIFEMGRRLASEIKTFILENISGQSLHRLSFIGHSLGGVIIRAALPRLSDYRSKFHTFMSFSSPHLGYQVNASSVIGAGMWLLQKMKNSNCLKQLAMTDHSDPYETCLYKLSLIGKLDCFENVLLLSSRQDSYAPYESARIQMELQFMSANCPLKNIHCEMVRNILKNVKPGRLRRLDVAFKIEETNIDSLIGRTAHILFLENAELIKTIIYTHQSMFS